MKSVDELTNEEITNYLTGKKNKRSYTVTGLQQADIAERIYNLFHGQKQTQDEQKSAASQSYKPADPAADRPTSKHSAGFCRITLFFTGTLEGQ